MGLTYGFYNSVNGDRKYDAVQISSMFDGLIIDGVFSSIGDCFIVKARSGITVNIGSGKAWFNHSWIYNDDDYGMGLLPADSSLDRIDAIVIEINSTEAVRANRFLTIQGTPSYNPKEPILKNEPDVHQYPLCYIYRRRGSTSILQEDITNKVGSPSTPFVIGILKTIDLNKLLGQWEDSLSNFTLRQKREFLDWFINIKNEANSMKDELDKTLDNMFKDFRDWFQRIKNQLSTDSAGKLQLEIDRQEIEQILLIGFAKCVKTVNDDGRIIVSKSDDGRTVTKTFSEDFKKMTAILTSRNGNEIAKLIKTFSVDGKTITNDLAIM